MAMRIQVSSRLVCVLMSQAGIYGLPGPTRVKRLRGVVSADDLVNRKFHRVRPNELWVTDITGRTRERDLRIHRDLPQPPASPLRARLPHPN
jgi:hypothetical protein